MPPTTGSSFPIYPAPPHLGNFWHPSIERVPELLTSYMNHPKIEAEVHYVEVCLVLREAQDTTKRLHWCLLFLNNRWDDITIDASSEGRCAQIQQRNETWLVDPCSGLGGNGEQFLHFLNSDELATRRLTLQSIAILSCPAPPHHWTFKNVILHLAQNPYKELLCCSVAQPGQEESHIVNSTMKWVTIMLSKLPCLGSFQKKQLMDAILLVAREMRIVSKRELELSTGVEQIP